MTTTKLSPEQQESARKTMQILLRAFADHKLAHVAAVVGIDVSNVSRWKTDKLPQFAEILTVLGLKLAPVEAKLYDEEDIRALIHLSRRSLESVTPDSLAKGGAL